MKKIIISLSILSALIIYTGCATVLSGTTQSINFESSPSGAAIFLDGERVGVTPFTSTLKKNKYKKIVISPGPGNPDQAGSCLKIVKYFYKSIPILGVCLGHQIIGQVFGSKIIGAKKIMHGNQMEEKFHTKRLRTKL